MKINAIPVEAFLQHTPKQIKDTLTKKVNVLFQNNKVVMLSPFEVYINRFFWELHVKYPGTKITDSHSVTKYTKGDMFNKGTPKKVFTAVWRDYYYKHMLPNNIPKHPTMEKYHRSIFETLNWIYDEAGDELEDYVMTLSILDGLEIMDMEKLIEAKEVLKERPTEYNIRNLYKTLDEVANDPKLKHNSIIKSYLSGATNPTQFFQTWGALGKMTDIDDSIFKHAMTSATIEGKNDLYEIYASTRVALSALLASSSTIGKTDYLGKRVQMVANVLANLHVGDCGTTEYSKHYVKPSDENYKGDLVELKYKWYKCPIDGTLKMIDGTEEHLIGTTIEYRSVSKCKIPDKYGVCSVCFGELHTNLYEKWNVGVLAMTIISAFLIQVLLSKKHKTDSGESATINLPPNFEKLLFIKKDGFAVRKEALTNRRTLYLEVNENEFMGLSDVMNNPNTDRLDQLGISSLSKITLIAGKKDEPETRYSGELSNNGRRGSFTSDFLRYLSTATIVKNRSRIIIDMKGWKSVKPFIFLPQVEYSFEQVIKQFENLVQAKQSKSSNAKLRESPDGLLSKLFKTLNTKLSVNMVYIECLVYAMSIVDDDDYDLTRFSTKEPKLRTLNGTITGRSIGNTLPSGYLKQKIVSGIHSVKSNVDTMLDVIIDPDTFLHHYNGRLGSYKNINNPLP